MALTNNDARIVLGMVARGDKEHDIAAWFGENQARVAEVKQGSHGSVTAAPAAELPPTVPVPMTCSIRAREAHGGAMRKPCGPKRAQHEPCIQNERGNEL